MGREAAKLLGPQLFFAVTCSDSELSRSAMVEVVGQSVRVVDTGLLRLGGTKGSRSHPIFHSGCQTSPETGWIS